MRKILLILATLATLIGLSACASGTAVKGYSGDSGSGTSAVQAADTKPDVNPDKTWAVAFAHAGGPDLIDDVTRHASGVSDALGVSDIDGAVDEAYAAEDSAKDVIDLIDSMDESEGSVLASESRNLWQQCADAYGNSGDALSDLDVPAINAATDDLNQCSAEMSRITDKVNAL